MNLSGTKLKSICKRSRCIAMEAGKLLIKKNRSGSKVKLKGRIDLVTDADLASEKYIIKALRDSFPDFSILAEEGSSVETGSDFRWVIDPLDGTTNFAHNFPFYCVSIGLEYQGNVILGVVYDPEREEQFYAYSGGGAFLNGRKIKVSDSSKLEKSLLATGFPYDIGTSREDNLKYFRRFVKQAQAVRRAGSAALDLCYLACGRFDGFWELKLHPWDCAAGIIIITEAGGRVTDFYGRNFSIYDKYILASNGRIHSQMKKVLASQ